MKRSTEEPQSCCSKFIFRSKLFVKEQIQKKQLQHDNNGNFSSRSYCTGLRETYRIDSSAEFEQV